MPYEEGGFLAMCRETGVIKQAGTVEEAKEKLISSTKLLTETALKDSRFAINLRAGLPMKYKIIFYKALLGLFVHTLMRQANELVISRYNHPLVSHA
ncbi:MAG: hypothetical protein Q8Q03_03205 [bacterium]|nr:hypothetical protein [bacterium]